MAANVIKFETVKEKIIDAIKDEKRFKKLNLNESVTLIEGFVSQPYSMKLSNSIEIGGPTIPMVLLLGNDTGRIYFFAYKALIQENEG